MSGQRIATAVLAVFAAFFFAGASPAKIGRVILTQPDGTLISATLHGDEHANWVCACDGCVIVQDGGGWWCYARFDIAGNKFTTSYIYGKDTPPGEVLEGSRSVPKEKILGEAALRRASAPAEERIALRRVKPHADEDEAPVRHALIILAEFDDLPFRYTWEDFQNLICSDNQESAKSYLNLQWQGSLDFQIDIAGPVTLSKGYAYYGGNDTYGADKNAYEMIVEACRLSDDLVDFSLYDNDGDGKADNVFVFYSGPDASQGAGDDYVWSHMWYLTSAKVNLRLDGVQIDNYACTSELRRTAGDDGTVDYSLATIGTFCHEYTHSFGFPDLYDTDGDSSGGYAEGLWRSIDLMDAGNQNGGGAVPPNYSALEKYIFGIGEAVPLEIGSVTLSPGEFRVLETDNEDEVWLFECRDNRGWDSYIGGNGLLVYHLDRSSRSAGYSTSKRRDISFAERWRYNEFNANPQWQGADLVEPDPTAGASFRQAMSQDPPDYNAIINMTAHAFWPFMDSNSLSGRTDPPLLFRSGEEAPVTVSDITRNADGTVSFLVNENTFEKAPWARIDDTLILQDGAILRWSSDNPEYEGPSYIKMGVAGDNNVEEIEVLPYQTGKYAYCAEGLSSRQAYTVQLYFKASGAPGRINSGASFTTKAAPSADALPYIYLPVKRNTDNSFPRGTRIPLRLWNVTDVEFVQWFFDGERIHPEGDYYWTVPRSGSLSAVISYGDGSSETIFKKINVR